jgi:hypothetical protein
MAMDRKFVRKFSSMDKRGLLSAGVLTALAGSSIEVGWSVFHQDLVGQEYRIGCQ